MFHKYFIVLISLLAFASCNDNREECSDDNIVLIDDYSPDCRYVDPFFNENSGLRKKLNYESFFKTYFSVPTEVGFSLDENINVFLRLLHGNAVYTMYTKNRNVNLAWSSDCKMTEKISSEQMSEINLLEEKIKTSHRFRHNCMASDEIVLEIWKGKQEKGSLKSYMIMSENGAPLKSELHDYFEQKIFIHGCKERAADFERKKQVEKFQQQEERKKRDAKLKKEIEAEIKKYQKNYGDSKK